MKKYTREGRMARRLRNALAKKGHSEEAIQDAVNVVMGIKEEYRITRKHIEAINGAFKTADLLVLRKGGGKVYSLEGYQALQAGARKAGNVKKTRLIILKARKSCLTVWPAVEEGAPA